MDVEKAILNRRSIRKFKDLPVEAEKIAALLEAARLAPSGSNRQPWRFLVLEDPDIRKLVAAVSPQVFVGQAPVIIICYADLRCWLPARIKRGWKELMNSGTVHGKDMELDLSLLSSNPLDTREQELQNYIPHAFLDVGIAIEHMALAALEHGLGTCWCRLVDESKLQEIFKLPDYYKFVSMLLVGYPDQQPSPRPRKNVEYLLIKPGEEIKEQT
jgi:nitroreductase